MSAFAWIDHSEKQRRQILEAIDLFREKDTRDELGIAGIRDAFSDMLFPGTGALQTRARYFFFVPWMYRGFEAERVSSAEVTRKGRAFEIALIDRLADSSDPAGTIGIQARSSLQRIPSSIYWNGLKLLRVCQFPGSQAEYHRTLDRQAAVGAAVRRNDDGEVVGWVARAWHAALPATPAAFPSNVSLTLTVPEARYLKGRVLESHRQSLFAFSSIATTWTRTPNSHGSIRRRSRRRSNCGGRLSMRAASLRSCTGQRFSATCTWESSTRAGTA
jgi:hypothetical protein